MKWSVCGLMLVMVAPGIAYSQVGSIGGSLIPKKSPPAAIPAPPTDTPAPQPPQKKSLDRTDPEATAVACLRAYQRKDTATLADYAIAAAKPTWKEVDQQQEKHPAYKSLFTGRYWDLAQQFEPDDPLMIRYLDYKTVGIAFLTEDSKMVVVSLEWENGNWCFETIKHIDRGVFEARARERPAEVIVKAPRSKIDHDNRFDAISTAEAVLNAYKLRDLARLASLSNATNQELFLQMFKQGKKHERYESVFSGWRNEKVQKWNPRNYVPQTRYRDRNTVLVSFDGDFGEGEYYVVVLEWENNQLCFEDINSIDMIEFSDLPTKRPQQ